MADALDALFDDDKTEADPKPEAVKPAEGVGRDEHGRFAPKTEVAPPQAATPPAEPPKPVTPEPAKPDPKSDPFFVGMLDEREKRQKLEREIAELRAKQQPENIPSIQDPEAYAEYQQQQFARARIEERINVSEVIAREKHGDAVVDAAIAWGHEQVSSVPGFVQTQISQKHPIDWLVRQHKKDQLLKDVGDDVDGYVRKRWAELNPQSPLEPPPPVAAAPQQPAAPKPPPPSRSIVHAPASGSMQSEPVGPEATFEAAFPKR